MYYAEKVGEYWVVYHNGKELASFPITGNGNAKAAAQDFIKEEQARMKKVFAAERAARK